MKKSPSLIGICHVWIKNVKLLDGGSNKTFEPGTIGTLEVTEIGTDGQVINANFYPAGSKGFGSCIAPTWEYVR